MNAMMMPAGIFGGAQKPKKPSFFGEGGAGRDIAGAFGDVLLQYAGMQPMFGPNRQFQREYAARQALEAQKILAERQGKAADRIAKREDMQWEWANKPGLDTFEDNAGNVWTIDKQTGQVGQNPAFVDRADRYYFQGDKAINIPNPYDIPSAPVGKLTPIGGAQSSIPSGNPLSAPQSAVEAEYIRLYGPEAGPQMYQNLIGGR